jgi:hypothetical protein
MSTNDETKAPKRRGRPPKNAPKGTVGRPRDPKGAMKEFRDRILNSPRSEKVLNAVFEAALDPEHKNQAAAWHILIDRLAPKKLFENEIEDNNLGNNRIQVTITTAESVNIDNHPKDPKVEPKVKDIEGEYSKVIQDQD